MAIQPPSDIVLDVAQAADPVKLQAAAEKLARIAAGKGATGGAFATIMDAARAVQQPSAGEATSPATMLSNLHRQTPTAATRPLDAPSPTSAQAKAYEGLEAVFLQTYLDAMLPKNEGLFGDSASGGTTRFFLAQQLATQLAKSGKIGLAKSLFAAHAPAGSQGPKVAAAVPLDITTLHLDASHKL